MTITDGLLLGILGILLTTVGMMIAYIIGYKSVNKKIKKEETPNALHDLLKRE